MSELNPRHVEAVLSAINRCPFFLHMSMTVTEIGVGCSAVFVEIKKDHMNPFGGLHGGAYAAAIDTAAYWAAYCDLPEGKGLISIDLKVDFLAPVTSGGVTVIGKQIKAGRSIRLCEATMFSEDRLLAHGTSKLMVTGDKQSIDQVADYLGPIALPPKLTGEANAVR